MERHRRQQPEESHAAGAAGVRLGFWAAILTTVVATIFAAFGVATPPRSGPFCGAACVAYPYVDVSRFIPGDYLWLVPGMVLAALVVVLVACIHSYAPAARRTFSGAAQAFAVAYAVVIVLDYFTQLAVVVPSLQSGQTQGLSLFTQYNPHGFFIALEAVGYLMLSSTLLFAAAVFTRGRSERAVRWLFSLSFGLAVVAFVGLYLLRRDLVAFEVAILVINWIALIPGGVLLSVVFRRGSAATKE